MGRGREVPSPLYLCKTTEYRPTKEDMRRRYFNQNCAGGRYVFIYLNTFKMFRSTRTFLNISPVRSLVVNSFLTTQSPPSPLYSSANDIICTRNEPCTVCLTDCNGMELKRPSDVPLSKRWVPRFNPVVTLVGHCSAAKPSFPKPLISAECPSSKQLLLLVHHLHIV